MEQKEWTLINDSHPLFNQWRKGAVESGKSYIECFFKNEDPNDLIPQFKVIENERY